MASATADVAWPLLPDSYVKGAKIGKGAFAEVYIGDCPSVSRRCALKV